MIAIVKRVRLPVVLLLERKKNNWCAGGKRFGAVLEIKIGASEGKLCYKRRETFVAVEEKYLVCASEKICRGLVHNVL